MEAESRYTVVGGMLLALIAAMVVAVVWLKNVGGRNDFNRYTIYFEHQSLDGLEIGGEVSLRGIKVGRVEDYTMAGQALNRVRVDVRVDRRAPVFTGTAAVVTRNFVTGIAAITLINPGEPGEPLTQVAPNEDYPVIAEGKSDLEEITGRVNRVGEMASTALGNINALLNTENRDALMGTIRSLRDLSVAMQRRLQTLDGALQQVGTAAESVGGAAQRLGHSGERVAAVAEKGIERLDGTLAETEKTMAEARVALEKVAAATDAVQRQAVSTARRLEDTAAGVDQQLDAAVSELRLSTETMTRVMDKLSNPKAALLGPGKGQLGPGEKLP
jgi:phospholipid/cholesterol/gamma-HCH transport system substrate-binding protein